MTEYTLEEFAQRVFGWDADRARRAMRNRLSTPTGDASRVRSLRMAVPALSNVAAAMPADVVVSVATTDRDTWLDRVYVVVDLDGFDEWVADIRRRFVAGAA